MGPIWYFPCVGVNTDASCSLCMFTRWYLCTRFSFSVWVMQETDSKGHTGKWRRHPESDTHHKLFWLRVITTSWGDGTIFFVLIIKGTDVVFLIFLPPDPKVSRPPTYPVTAILSILIKQSQWVLWIQFPERMKPSELDWSGFTFFSLSLSLFPRTTHWSVRFHFASL